MSEVARATWDAALLPPSRGGGRGLVHLNVSELTVPRADLHVDDVRRGDHSHDCLHWFMQAKACLAAADDKRDKSRSVGASRKMMRSPLGVFARASSCSWFHAARPHHMGVAQLSSAAPRRHRPHTHAHTTHDDITTGSSRCRRGGSCYSSICSTRAATT